MLSQCGIGRLIQVNQVPRQDPEILTILAARKPGSMDWKRSFAALFEVEMHHQGSIGHFGPRSSV
jgi:hypothetical protein